MDKKAIPLQGWTGPKGSRRLRFSDFKTMGTRRWYVCQPYAPAGIAMGSPLLYTVIANITLSKFLIF